MEVQMSSLSSEETDGFNNLIAARIRISGMLHANAIASTANLASATAAPSASASNSPLGLPGTAAAGFGGGGGDGGLRGAQGIGFEHGSNEREREAFTMASSAVNWNGGDTDFQVSWRLCPSRSHAY